MGRPAQIPSEEIYNKIKETVSDVPRKENETYGEYAIRICKYAQIDLISEKNMSRAMRSNTYKEYKDILYEETHHKTKKDDPDYSDDLHDLIKQIYDRIERIESKLDQSEVKIIAQPKDCTHWKDAHDECIKANKGGIIS